MLHARMLRYIDEVARLGSIRAAGERLHISPSSINKQILQLEEAFGEPLFERLPRGLRLTPAGEILVVHIRHTLKEYAQLKAEIRGFKTLESGEVVMATMNGLAGGIVAKLAAQFCSRHTRLKICLKAMLADDIVQAVLDGEADLGFGFNLPMLPQLECLWQADERLGAIMSPHHALAQMESVSLASCQPYPLIFADKSMLIYGMVMEAFAAAGLNVEPKFLTNSIEAMKCLAMSGDNITFLSKSDIVEEERSHSLIYRRIREETFGKNMLTLVQRERRNPNLAAIMFGEELIASLKTTI